MVSLIGLGTMLLFVGCKRETPVATEPDQRQPSAKSQVAPLTAEAKRRGEEILLKYSRKVGDSWFTMTRFEGSYWTLHQSKRYQIHSEYEDGGTFTPTDADRLNGLQWAEYVRCNWSLNRVYLQDASPPRWSEWADGPSVTSVKMILKNGVWGYEGSGFPFPFGEKFYKQPSSEEIPK